MVFCYKIITESPRRSLAASPTKRSPRRTLPIVPSESVAKWDCDNYTSDTIGSIPEREWRLLAALARKREEERERDRLADQFRKMWLKEKQERETIETETCAQFERYISGRRACERARLEAQRRRRSRERRARADRLLESIRGKEQRCADLLTLRDDGRMNKLIGMALAGVARARLAAERRGGLGAQEARRRHAQLLQARARGHDASRRRGDRLRDASQRVAITNALGTWETALQRRELAAAEATRRALTAAHLAMGSARGARLARDRQAKATRARETAEYAARLRDAVKSDGSR